VESRRRIAVVVAVSAFALGVAGYLSRLSPVSSNAMGHGEGDGQDPTGTSTGRGEEQPGALASSTATDSLVVPSASSHAVRGSVSCHHDDECRGPKTATCVVPKCVQGACKYDPSACECDGPEDCDDGEPCTNDVCFSSTRKCVHVQLDDCT
jgi:hypothetical protein